MSEPNLVLVGPMGAGKSTVGRLVAARLGRPFVDLDRELEALAGASVAQVFAQRGEAAFRALEAEVCRRYARPQGLVLAAGGGALTRSASADPLRAGGRLIGLRAGVETLWARLAAAPPRPLLERLPAGARRERLAALLRGRAASYAAVDVELDAEPEAAAVAAELARLARSSLARTPRLLQRMDAASSAVYVDAGARQHVGAALTVAGHAPGPAIVLTEPRVRALHGEALLAGLADAGFAPRVLEVPAGEAAKTPAVLTRVWSELLELGLQRHVPIVALGGGALTDLAGFAASTALRGVPWAAVPTTLLGMVDAGLGGKTAIDLPAGKNLAGSFAPPVAVVLDPECLATLPAGTPPGMAEVLKHALLADPELWATLHALAARPDPRRALDAATLVRAARVKLARVAEDPYDRGVRRTLNLGHTFAHGFERAADFALAHGHAVAVGLVAAAAVSEARGLCAPGLTAEVEDALVRWRLPTRLPARWAAATRAAIRHDKKAQGARVEAILLAGVGRALREWIPFAELEVGLARVLTLQEPASVS